MHILQFMKKIPAFILSLFSFLFFVIPAFADTVNGWTNIDTFGPPTYYFNSVGSIITVPFTVLDSTKNYTIFAICDTDIPTDILGIQFGNYSGGLESR